VVTDSNELLGQALGTCTLQRLLGRGGMGAVYLAQQSRPRRTVAVKVLLPNLVEQRPRAEFLARFRREADAIAALDHVNIMPVYEYSEEGDIAYLVMPYVTGGTLRDVIEKRGSLSLEEIVPIIEQAAAGLDNAHAHGIVHRDLKPGNILFHADGRVLLADFGLAKVLKDVTDQESSNGHLTSIGTIVGTPEYLSPEQGTGDTIDYRTDVYSLGIVLYQMLAGRVPFTGTSPVAVAIKHTIETPPPPTRFNPSIPPAVEAVVLKAIAKKPDQRFSSAGEFAISLRQAVIAAGVTIPRTDEPFYQNTGKHISTGLHSPMTDPPKPFAEKDKEEETPTELVHQPLESAENGMPSMSTMLMKDEMPGQAAPTVANTPEQPIAEYHNDQTVASPQVQTPSPWTPPPPPQPMYQRQGVEQARPAVAAQMLADQHAIPYPQKQAKRSSIWMILVGSVLVVLIVGGGLITYMSHNAGLSNNNHNGQGPTTLTTGTAVNTTPTQTATPPSLNNMPPLNSAVANQAGSPIYRTYTPGQGCDPQGGQWSNTSGVSVTCNNAQNSVTVTNNGSSVGGTILTQMTGGVQTPNGDNYILQVEAVVNNNPGGDFGVFYNYQPGNPPVQAESIQIQPSANTYEPFYYNDANDSTPMTSNKQPITTQLKAVQGDITIDVVVQGTSFNYYINGKHVGNASSAGYSSGSVGLLVNPGVSMTFKNLQIYSTN